MSTPSLAARYHERTKYTPEALAQGASHLDVRRQPPPFKPWVEGERLRLGGRSPGEQGPDPYAGERLDRVRLGRLLHHTYGVTRVWQAEGQALYLRAAPSAGGLYPTELYVASRDIEDVPDGLWAYHGGDHALQLCWAGDFVNDLERFAFGAPAVGAAHAVLIGTGFHERSSWRYRERAYRRVLLDAGHVFGNALQAGAADGLGITLAPDFVDDGVDGLLLLDPAREGTLLLAAVGTTPGTALRAGLRSREDRPRDALDDGTWIPMVHRAGQLDVGAEPVTGATPVHAPPSKAMGLDDTPLPGGAPVLEAIRQRRSTRTFRRQGVPSHALGRILFHASPRAGSPGPCLAPGLLETYVVVAGVSGMPPGVYRYDAELHALVPRARGAVRAALHQAALGQDLARDAAFTVVHTFDLPAAIERYGDRAYRTAHLEAGLVGQYLNLAALRLGLGASGIGGFFDDLVNAILGLPESHAIAYLTTIGVPA
ncbi:MAG: SagB/ThcOx family dehydrogenase [Planctomycetes bacterium]|nr:SagB/ThcOx family dehydrogenase [Planctomycetota bacterium]MCB9900952.1 SagB/ThcOx family dehydrogenase [Planctomycetota bacterium]